MILFIIGMIVGANLGVVVMCLVSISKDNPTDESLQKIHSGVNQKEEGHEQESGTRPNKKLSHKEKSTKRVASRTNKTN